METKKNNDEQALLAEIKKDIKLKKYFENKKIVKKIFIPNKLINILTS
jgi:leucyl-tRNA synthetase